MLKSVQPLRFPPVSANSFTQTCLRSLSISMSLMPQDSELRHIQLALITTQPLASYELEILRRSLTSTLSLVESGRSVDIEAADLEAALESLFKYKSSAVQA